MTDLSLLIVWSAQGHKATFLILLDLEQLQLGNSSIVTIGDGIEVFLPFWRIVIGVEWLHVLGK